MEERAGHCNWPEDQSEGGESRMLPVRLVGDDVTMTTPDGSSRRPIGLDTAASTSALPAVAEAVAQFLPWYSSVHRGAGAKSRYSTARYEEARQVMLDFVGADPGTHLAVFPRNTTEALNIIAFRLRLTPADVVLTTLAEHHANLLPWRRHARLRYIEVDEEGTFAVESVLAGLDQSPRPKVLALTGASNVTGWIPPLKRTVAAARERGVLVVLDAAQLAPHRPIRMQELGVDVLAFSGHKLYAPFGAGALVAPRRLLAEGEPLLVGGGAVDVVGLEAVLWADGPDREEAGSPNVIGVIALTAALHELQRIGWDAITAHDQALSARLDQQLGTVPHLTRLGSPRATRAPGTPGASGAREAALPVGEDRLPVAAFTLEGTHHALVAARLASEHGIAVRSGCFCAHPLLTRLLRLTPQHVAAYQDDARTGRKDRRPGAVRASAGLGTTLEDIDALGGALRALAVTPERAADYEQDADGEFTPAPGPLAARALPQPRRHAGSPTGAPPR